MGKAAHEHAIQEYYSKTPSSVKKALSHAKLFRKLYAPPLFFLFIGCGSTLNFGTSDLFAFMFSLLLLVLHSGDEQVDFSTFTSPFKPTAIHESMRQMLYQYMGNERKSYVSSWENTFGCLLKKTLV